MTQYTYLRVFTSTRDKLKALGAKGDTYDIILNRLMDKASKK